MNLVFQELTIAHFRSFNAPQTLQLNRQSGLWFMRGVNAVEPELGANGCLVGNTLIDCPRDLSQHPKGIPIKNLVGKQFYTYSWDFNKDAVVLSRVSDVWCTGKKPVYKVLLTAYGSRRKQGIKGKGSGVGRYLPPCELVGTYDHPVLLSDGTWRKLGELRKGDSVKSLYRRHADRGKIMWTSNVKKVQFSVGWQTQIRNPLVYYGCVKAVSEQQFVCAQAHGERLGTGRQFHVHHKDHNPYNHAPDNLEWKGASKHLSEHTSERNKQGTAGWKVSGVHPRGMQGKKHTQEAKHRISVNSPRRRRALNHMVTSVPRYVGVQDVYDMEVENTHNFVANGVFVHNSGKSSVWDALTWCIYGRTAAGLKNPDVKPWTGKGVPDVELLLELDGVATTLRRKATTNGFWVDGKEAGSDQGAAVVGLSFEVFVNTIVFAQGQPLFFDHTAKEKMALLAEVLGFERWEERSQKAAAAVRELESLAAEIAGEITGLTAALTQAQDLLERTKIAVQDWEQTKRQRAEEARQEIAEQEAVLAKHDKRWADAELAYDGAGTELKALQEKAPARNARLRAAQQAFYEAEQEIIKYERQLRELQQQYDELGEAEECPTCGQPLKGTNLDRHQKELRRQIKQLRPLAEAVIPDDLTEELGAALGDVQYAEREITALERKEREARTILDFLKPARAEAQAIIALKHRAIADQQQQSNPHSEQLQTLRRKVAQAQTALSEAQEDAELTEQKLVRTKFWVKGFRDVQLYALEEVLQELEIATQATLVEVGLADWRITYTVEKETKAGTIQRGLTAIVHSPHNKNPVRWESWSGGERQRLRLSGALALSEVLLNHASITPNLEVLDEPTRHLSDQGIQGLCRLLGQRAVDLGRTSWLVDHHAREGNSFVSSVVVRKGPRGSEFVLP